VPTIDAYYFRLTNENLYYTETPSDSVVLGAIQISNIVRTLPYMSKGCFKIVDKEKDEWQVCSIDGSCPKDWKEAIDTMLGKTTFDPCPEDDGNAILVIQP
jgi:hypothetical protein